MWCNLSPVGIIAPAIALTFALGVTAGEADPKLRRSAWHAIGACALATLATPAFAAFPAQAFAALRVDRTLVGVVAIHPIEVAPAAYRIGFTLVVLAFLALGSGARVRAGDASLVIFAALLALANGAYIAVFGVLVAPILARSAYESLARHDLRDTTYRAADFVLGAAALALTGVLAIACVPRAEAALAAQPFALANVAFANPTPHRFFCADVDWCSYVRARGPRGTTVLMDGRVAAYSAVDVETQRSLEHASAGWRAMLDRNRIDAMLVRRDRALGTLLAMRGDWRAIASDASAELYVRTKPLR
ncbi:MAG: hypothetical protein IAI50_20405 [Candidatus Eremiobacteraeota bacterium]|nr:hypothetical protein [Candidatus Eremiobacteraeota bacterium]